MPGRTPRDAFHAFVAPLGTSLSCLGPAKITASAGGQTAPGVVHVWTINREAGIGLRDGWHFEAQMHYEMVQDDDRQWRVRTHGYRYRLAKLGHHVFRIHWHPTKISTYHLPHVHLNLAGGKSGVLTTLDKHLPTGRLTFEDAIEWTFEVGVKPARGDWKQILDQSRTSHIENRTWSTYPPEGPTVEP